MESDESDREFQTDEDKRGQEKKRKYSAVSKDSQETQEAKYVVGMKGWCCPYPSV